MSITLFQFRSGFGVPCPSSFCMKAEVLLIMSGLEYTSKVISDPRKGPNGKLPFIKDGSTVVADSALIQRYMEEHHNVDFDGHLSAQERAIGHAFGRMIEERLYWVLVYSRWLDPINKDVTAKFWFGGMPPVLRHLVPIMAQRQVKANLDGHGLGKHSPEQIYEFGKADVQALSDLLGDKDFMLGDKPSSLDATAFSCISNILRKETPSPLCDFAHTLQNLVAYDERCRQRWFADFKV